MTRAAEGGVAARHGGTLPTLVSVVPDKGGSEWGAEDTATLVPTQLAPS